MVHYLEVGMGESRAPHDSDNHECTKEMVVYVYVTVSTQLEVAGPRGWEEGGDKGKK